jgi:hypothetical protein
VLLACDPVHVAPLSLPELVRATKMLALQRELDVQLHMIKSNWKLNLFVPCPAARQFQFSFVRQNLDVFYLLKVRFRS